MQVGTASEEVGGSQASQRYAGAGPAGRGKKYGGGKKSPNREKLQRGRGVAVLVKGGWGHRDPLVETICGCTPELATV